MKDEWTQMLRFGLDASETVATVGIPEQVAQVICVRIQNGSLSFGDRIVELTLAREFGVGQTAVREALIRLEAMGFVERIPNRGTYIAKLERTDVQEILEVRYAIERLVVERILQRSKGEKLNWSAASRQVMAMKRAVEKADSHAFREADLLFHRILWQMAENRSLFMELNRLVTKLFVFVALTRQFRDSRSWCERFRRNAGEHEEFFEALRSSAATVHDLLHAQYEQSLRDWQNQFEPLPSES